MIPTNPAPDSQGRLGLVIGVAVALAVGLFLSLGVAKVLEGADIAAPRTNLDVLGLFQSRLVEVKAARGIAYLGDSTGMSGKGAKYSIPGRLGISLQKNPARPPVVSLAEAGLGPMDFYLLAEEVSRSQPTAVILSVNLAALSHFWSQRLSHPEFATAMRGDRWLEAFGLPSVVNGVKADRLILYPGLRALGLGEVWRDVNRYQAQFLRGWTELGIALGSRGEVGYGESPKPRGSVPIESPQDQFALLEERLRQQQWNHYGKAIRGVDPDDPSLQILAATLRHWEGLDIPILMVVIPINVELVQGLGLDDPEGRKQTLDALAHVAQDNSAEFLDLHDLLPQESFADWQGHYSLDSKPHGPSLIAARIEPVLVSMFEGRR